MRIESKFAEMLAGSASDLTTAGRFLKIMLRLKDILE